MLHLSGASGGEDGGSIVSAFTMQTETTAGWGGRHGRGGRSRLDLEAGDGEEGFERRDGGRNGEVPQRDDDTCSRVRHRTKLVGFHAMRFWRYAARRFADLRR